MMGALGALNDVFIEHVNVLFILVSKRIILIMIIKSTYV